MTDAPQGPGWWQGADHRWYPPEQHPGSAGEAPGASGGPPAVKGFAGRTSVNAWLLAGGLVVAVVATFLPFATISYKVFGSLLGSHEVGADGAAQFVVFVLVAAAAGLAWPVLTGSAMAVNRLIGLSAVTFLLGALMLIWFANVSSSDSDAGDIADVSPGSGLQLYGAAMVVIALTVIRLWIQRSRTHKP